MKLFVGLGNPTPEYAATKHNVGFMLADKLADKISADNWREKFNALIAESFFGGEKIIIVKPQTFMNLSGEAVAPIMNFYKLGADDLIVAHDRFGRVGKRQTTREVIASGEQSGQSVTTVVAWQQDINDGGGQRFDVFDDAWTTLV